MKAQLLILLILLFCSTYCSGQSDCQWLISNGSGKNSYNSGTNTYSGVITTDFALYGVSMPDVNNHQKAANDVFIIYNDGNHFNSREVNSLGRFYEAGLKSNDMNHNFRGTSSIGYLYLTDIYESDDPPEAVRVAGGSVAGSAVNNTGITNSPLLSANHHVVLTRDITIIVNLDAFSDDDKERISQGGTLSLAFDGIEDPTNHHHSDYGLDVFLVSPIFIDGTGPHYDYPIGTLDAVSSQEVIIKPDNKQLNGYRYLNLKTNPDEIYKYAPLPGDTFKAIFTLKLNGQPIGSQLRESILHSYDPNFLRVDSISRASDNGYYVFYHLEFENEGDQPAKELEAQVQFPEVFDLSDIEALKWYAAGRSCSGALRPAGNKGNFLFDETTHDDLIICDTTTLAGALLPSDTTRCKGYVTFKVKVKPGYDVRNVDNSLMLIEPKVAFDNIWFDLNEFYDLRVRQHGKISRPITGGTEPCVPEWVWFAAFALVCVVCLYFLFKR